MHPKVIILLTLLTLWMSLSIAQEPQPTFRHYTVQDGLPSSEVYHCFQDSKGYMWFASDRGVSRYDGYSFVNYGVGDGLPDNTVFNIIEDSKGRIWFASISGQLAYFDNGTIHLYKYNSIITQIIKTMYKGSFYVGSKDDVYLSYYLHGYYLISASGEMQQLRMEHDGSYSIDQVDSSVFILSSFSKGNRQLLMYVSTEDINTVVPFKDMKHAKNNNVIKRNNGSLLFSGWDGLIEILSDSISNHYPLTNPSIALFEDGNQNVWVGSIEKGVSFYSPANLSIPERIYLDGYSVSSICQDREGGFWFTTLEDGVFYMASNEILTYDLNSGLSSNKMGVLESDGKGTLFAAYQSDAVQIISDTVFDQISLPAALKTKTQINSLLFDGEHSRLHIATNRPEYVIYNLSSHHSYRTSKALGISDMVIQKSGDVLGWSAGNVAIYSNGEWSMNLLSSDKYITIDVLYKDENQVLWIGGPQGLGVYKYGDVEFNPLDNELLKTRVTDIKSFNKNSICVATRGAGVLFLVGDSVLQLDQANGIQSNNVEDLYIDSNVVWLTSNKGLNKIVFSSFADWVYTIESYDINDGLPSNELRAVLKVDDHIWVSSNMGLTVFNPKNVLKNPIAPPIWITGLKVSEQDRELLNSYELTHDMNQLQISFKGISFKKPGEVLYRYKMVGVDSGWTYSNNTSVRYAAMPSGEFTFEVSASVDNEKWSSAPVVMSFRILPPYWETWWFRSLVALVISGLVYLAFKIKILTHNKDVTRELLLLLIGMFRRKKYLYVKEDGRLVRIDPVKINWIQAAHVYVEIHTRDTRHIVRYSLTAIEKKLPAPEQFMRVHRSYIVRLDKIKAINQNEVTIASNTIPISESYKSQLKELRDRLESVNA